MEVFMIRAGRFLLSAVVPIAVLMAAAVYPDAAFAQAAQASITGVVRDASGEVVPGVTVEVSSPALIERTRTGVTDGRGFYRIIDLPGGTYTVTFTLTGFTTIRREGVELEGAFAALDQRGSQRRVAHRNGHRLGPGADRQRPERAT
jgi:hypothetical protein